MIGPYRWFSLKSSRIQDDRVEVLDQPFKVYAGMYGPFVSMMSRKGSFFVVPRNPEGRVVKTMPIEKFDGLSWFSSLSESGFIPTGQPFG